MSVSAAGSPDIVQLLMMRKAMSAEQTQNEQLLAALPQPAPTPPAPSQPARTFYL